MSIRMKLAAVAGCVALGVGVGCLWGAVENAKERLPEQVAAHFTLYGTADGWMAREAVVNSFVWVAAGFAVFVPAVLALLRWVLLRWANLPGSWKTEDGSGQRRVANFLLIQSLWWAGLSAAFWAVQIWVMTDANGKQPARVDTGMIIGSAAVFLLAITGVAGWTAAWAPAMAKEKESGDV